jgi:hypothetical protein
LQLGEFYIVPRGLFVLCLPCKRRYCAIFGLSSLEAEVEGRKKKEKDFERHDNTTTTKARG